MLQDAALDPEHADSRLREAQMLRQSRRRLKGLNLLEVEDNLVNQHVAQELLAFEGAQLSLAANGCEGVEAVATANPRSTPC